MSQGLAVMWLRLLHEVCELFVSMSNTKENSLQGGTVYFGSWLPRCQSMAIGSSVSGVLRQCHSEGQSCLPHGSPGRGRKKEQKTGNTRGPSGDSLAPGCNAVG